MSLLLQILVLITLIYILPFFALASLVYKMEKYSHFTNKYDLKYGYIIALLPGASLGLCLCFGIEFLMFKLRGNK
jgi:hypothetical protein